MICNTIHTFTYCTDIVNVHDNRFTLDMYIYILYTIYIYIYVQYNDFTSTSPLLGPRLRPSHTPRPASQRLRCGGGEGLHGMISMRLCPLFAQFNSSHMEMSFLSWGYPQIISIHFTGGLAMKLEINHLFLGYPQLTYIGG